MQFARRPRGIVELFVYQIMERLLTKIRHNILLPTAEDRCCLSSIQ